MARTAKTVTRSSRTLRTFLLISASAIGLSACADIPPQFRVDKGSEPRYEDKTVRFRTTYYFRVFDLCEGVDVNGQSSSREITEDFQLTNPVFYRNDRTKPLRLEKDSLYRFTMTGKALAITNKIHFESGTLKSWQIDPFGASVEYDPDSGRFFFQSQEATQKEAERNKLFREVERLVKLRNDAEMKEFDTDIKTLISAAIKDIGGASADGFADSTSSGEVGEILNEASILSAQKAFIEVQAVIEELKTHKSLKMTGNFDFPKVADDASARPSPPAVTLSGERPNWDDLKATDISDTLSVLESELKVFGDASASIVGQSITLINDWTVRIEKAIATEVTAAEKSMIEANGLLANAETDLDDLVNRQERFTEVLNLLEPELVTAKTEFADEVKALEAANDLESLALTRKENADTAETEKQRAFDGAVAALEALKKPPATLLVPAPGTPTPPTAPAGQQPIPAGQLAAAENLVAEAKLALQTAKNEKVAADSAYPKIQQSAASALSSCSTADRKLVDIYTGILASASGSSLVWGDDKGPAECGKKEARSFTNKTDPVKPGWVEFTKLPQAIKDARTKISGQTTVTSDEAPIPKAAPRMPVENVQDSAASKADSAPSVAEVPNPAPEPSETPAVATPTNTALQVTANEKAEIFAELTKLRASVQRKIERARELAEMAQEIRRPASADDKLCGPGSAGRRGFQVMGPEGVRTFDQDERLMMAMSSSASPLIGVLKEVSSRVLDRRVTQSEPLLPYAQERVSILGAQRALDNFKLEAKPAAETSDALQVIVNAFSRTGDVGATP